MIAKLTELLIFAVLCTAAYYTFPMAHEAFVALGHAAQTAWHYARTAR